MIRARLASSLVLALASLGCGGAGTASTGNGTAEPPLRHDERVPGMEVPREPLGQTELITQPSASPIVTIRVVFDAGSAEDPDDRRGLTNLTSRLMVEGGAGELTYAQVLEALYPMAAELEAYTSRDQTAFVGRVHRDHLDRFYAIFRDVLLRPRMGRSDFERVRTRAKTAIELELRGNDDEELGKEALQAMLYDQHAYGHPELGTVSGLTAATVEDARLQRERVFCGGRATVGVAGGYPDGFADRVKGDVASLAGDRCLGRRELNAPLVVDAPRVLLVDKAEATSVAISMGLPIELTRAHPDYPALVLATAYFGEHRQFVGRLMQAMRGQRGLNYGDYAYTEHFEQEGWGRLPMPNIARRQQYFSIWIRPVRPEQAHFALRMAVRELDRFVANGLTREDFERVRTFVDRYYALHLQTESRRLGYAIDDGEYGVREPWLERLRAAWRALTPEQVNAAIRRHVDPRKLRIAVVTPNAEQFAAAIVSDRPSPIEYAAEVSAEVRAEDQEIVAYPLRVPRDRITIVPVARMFE